MANAKSNIFCPNCSANNRIEQNFCRFCGLNLRGAAESLTAQLSSGEKQRHFDKLQLIKKLTGYSEIGLFLTAFAGILFYAYGYFAQTAPPFGRKTFFFFIIAFLTTYSILDYLRRKNTAGYWEEINEENGASPGESNRRETAKLLKDKPFEPATASVTENSTRLLFAENKTTKLE